MLEKLIKSPYFMIIAAQVLYSIGDLIARANLKGGNFNLTNFYKNWFVIYFVLRQFAMFAQLYVFSKFELGKTGALFGAASICISSALGFLLLGEVLSVKNYLGIILAISAFMVLFLFDS